MPITFVLIDLTSVTGYVTDMSNIYSFNKDATKTPVKYFDFMVSSKDKVMHLYTITHCLFLAAEASFITSLNKLKNDEIECRKDRVSDSNDYLLYRFSEVSKVSLNYDNKGLLLERQPTASNLNFCLICDRVNIKAVTINLSAKEKLSSVTSVLFVRKAVAHGKTRSMEISF